MGNDASDTEEKIVLPEGLQREMIKFFLAALPPKSAGSDEDSRQTSPNKTEEG